MKQWQLFVAGLLLSLNGALFSAGDSLPIPTADEDIVISDSSDDDGIGKNTHLMQIPENALLRAIIACDRRGIVTCVSNGYSLSSEDILTLNQFIREHIKCAVNIEDAILFYNNLMGISNK